MANTDAPNGLKPVRHIAGGTIRPNEYKIPSGYNTAIFTGDAVKLLSSGYVAVAAAGNRLLGVFAGCSYPNSSGEQVFSRQWTASATTQGTVDVTAYIYDDPNQQVLLTLQILEIWQISLPQQVAPQQVNQLWKLAVQQEQELRIYVFLDYTMHQIMLMEPMVS